jgi:hypothetical protein
MQESVILCIGDWKKARFFSHDDVQHSDEMDRFVDHFHELCSLAIFPSVRSKAFDMPIRTLCDDDDH